MNPYRLILLILGALGAGIGLLAFAAGPGNYTLGATVFPFGAALLIVWLAVSAITWRAEPKKDDPADNVH